MPARNPSSGGIHLVFPNHLFGDDKKMTERNARVFLVEEPCFFGGPKAPAGRKYGINRLKLAYMRASMKSYLVFLRKKSPKVDVHYVDYDSVGRYDWLGKAGQIRAYDPLDFELVGRLRSIFGSRLRLIEPPLFPLSVSRISSFFDGPKKAVYRHGHFYKWAKDQLAILQDVESHDEANRLPLPRDHRYNVRLPRFDTPSEVDLYSEARGYIDAHPAFHENICGDYGNLSLYPLTHAAARRAFKSFVKDRLVRFGPYQDAIDADEAILYHSFCSTALNNGLLDSKWVLVEVRKLVPAARSGKLPMASLEAYVRQLCWRMWEVGIYLRFYNELKTSNHFGNKARLRWSRWRGTSKSTGTGIDILDREIDKAVMLGYAAHIPRLMVFLNAFVLLRVRLEDVVQWFMETVSMDATIHFMWSIVATMGAYDTRFMQKPYISTSSYLKRMSTYPAGAYGGRGGDLCDTWTALFYDFLAHNKSRLTGTSSVYLRNLAHFERRPAQARQQILKQAEEVRSSLTL